MFIGLRAVKTGSEHVHLEPENIHNSMHFPSNKACQHIDFQGVWFIDFDFAKIFKLISCLILIL